MEKSLPKREITFKVQKNEYTIKFPNVGQLIDIEIKKATYSSGQYNTLSSGNGMAYYASLLIDTIATFEVLVPELVKNMTIKTIAELDLDQSSELLAVYKDVYVPWFSEWLTIISTPAE